MATLKRVSVDNLNASEVSDLVRCVRTSLEKYGCSKPSSATWVELERLMNSAVSLRFVRKPVDMTSGLAILLNSWRFEKNLHAKVEGALRLLPHRFVPFSEFEGNMVLLFKKVAKQVVVENKTCTRFIHLLAGNGKSQVWMFLCFLAHCRAKAPEAYTILKSKLRIYTAEDMRKGKQCVLYKRDSCLLWLDDVAYSGIQMSEDIKAMTTVSLSRIIVGVVYASPASFQRLRRVASNYSSKLSVFKASNIQSLSSQHLKWLDDNDVMFFSPKGLPIESLFQILRAWAPCRTVFEHKIADALSIPTYMSLPLEYASPPVFKILDIASYEQKGTKHKLPSFPASEKHKLVSRGWLYGDFCEPKPSPMCFVPQYKNLKLHIPWNVDKMYQ